ncbi:MAG: glycosyltransferase family 2 protein [bacterium]|nr:glycosyltransferase family 2 protein [bacterium]
MKLSVIIPVYNERFTILEIIKKVEEVPVEKEIIVVDDGSTDGTREILQRFSQDSLYPDNKLNKDREHLKIIFKEKNEGKGSAIKEGLKNITGDIVVIQDADLEYNPMDWIKMLKVMEEKRADVIYGSRVLGKGEKSSLSFYLGGRLLSLLTNFLYRSNITDEPTCYKMFRTEIIKRINLKCKGFEFCPEVTAKVLKSGYKIYEVPITYKPRKIKEGKKIRWYDGLVAIWVLVKYRFFQ